MSSDTEGNGSPTGHTEIKVFLSYQEKKRDQPLTLPVFEGITVEEVITMVCQKLAITPVAVPLFALKNLLVAPADWLCLSHKISSVRVEKDYEFGLRIKVPDVNRLAHVDLEAYNFYFKQARKYILNGGVRMKYSDVIIGFGVTDMVRAVLEDGVSREQVEKKFMRYLTDKVRKKHRAFFLRRHVMEHFKHLMKQNHDSLYLKKQYMESFEKVVPDYLIEEFDTKQVLDDGEKKILLRVNPFDTEMPGIAMKEQLSDKWEHVCQIEDICYINTKDDGGVEISRKNGIPFSLKFEMMSGMISLVTLLDSYYRLICKSTFNLCNDMPTPSIQKLFLLKCHGPISGEFAYRKLAEKRDNAHGHFILRQSDRDYNSYYIDVCTKSSPLPTTIRIVASIDGSFRLENETKSYPSIPVLINDHRSESAEYPLLHYLPPSEYDESNLLLCRKESPVSRGQDPLEDLMGTMPVVIDGRDLRKFSLEPQRSQSRITTVYPGSWVVNNIVKRNVAVKVLNGKHPEVSIRDFLHLTSRWAFIKTNCVVRLYGITLSNPVAMVMENLPLGRLDLYLAEPGNRLNIKQNTLVEAATYVANALYYLADKNFVHGRIRCRKLLVASHTDTSFVVKLSDPGLSVSYDDFELHWIPPEFHDNKSKARDTGNADVWAFATTLWELFSYGAVPEERDYYAIRQFYGSRKLLPLPAACPKSVYFLMMECWSYDPLSRKTPQGIMRDINQFFFQVYNAQRNRYEAIVPKLRSEGDNISNHSDYSKKSENYKCNKRSVVSQMTLHTDLDAEDSIPTVENHAEEMEYQMTTFFPPLPYRYTTEFMDLPPPLLGSYDEECDNQFSITSMQSIYELDKEWNLVLKGLLGTGNWGRVFVGELHHLYEEKEIKKVAVKKLKEEHMNNMANLKELNKEIDILTKMTHPNIIHVYGRIEDPDLCLVMEYMEHGALKSYLCINQARLTPIMLTKWAMDIAEGMAYLQSKKYVHRDLAARNILVRDPVVKISDFGLARFLGNNNYYHIINRNRGLPMQWHAPESLEYQKFSFQSDVWSFGVVLFEMFSFGAEPILPGLKSTSAGEMCAALRKNIRLPQTKMCPSSIYKNIMAPCWRYDAVQRPTFPDLIIQLKEALEYMKG